MSLFFTVSTDATQQTTKMTRRGRAAQCTRSRNIVRSETRRFRYPRDETSESSATALDLLVLIVSVVQRIATSEYTRSREPHLVDLATHVETSGFATR